MELGAFSISLAVKDIDASRAFYEKLGFVSIGGDCGQGWTILKNGDHVIGLFQGMFDKNMLTFNPGCRRARHVHRCPGAEGTARGTGRRDPPGQHGIRVGAGQLRGGRPGR